VDKVDWKEDAVSFRGYIRRSGNSLVVTIPSELSQRFLLREGQEFVILGLSRSTPDFEGGLLIKLGYFTIYEKVPTLTLSVPQDEEVRQKVESAARRLGASKVILQSLEPETARIKVVFGGIVDGDIKRPRSLEEVQSIVPKLVSELRESGVKVLSADLDEEILEWRTVDPATVAKAPVKVGEKSRWAWET